jgi:Uroporphyrinogen-III synthase
MDWYLAKAVVSLHPKDGAVFFCGNIRRPELPDYLQVHEVPLQELVVYHTHEIPVAVNQPYDAVLFFSPSAVRSFFSVNSVPHTTALFAIGSTTANALQDAGYSNIVVANVAGKEAMIETFLNWYAASQKPVE